MVRFINMAPQEPIANNSNKPQSARGKKKWVKRRLNDVQRKLVAWGVPAILFFFATAMGWPHGGRTRSTNGFAAMFILWGFAALISLVLNLILWRNAKRD